MSSHLGGNRRGASAIQSISATSGIGLASSVKRAQQRLMALEIIYGPKVNYKLFDPFLKEWLETPDS